MQTSTMIKKNNEPSEAQLRDKRIVEKEAKIKILMEQIERSKASQAELIHKIANERHIVEERENTLSNPHAYSAVDMDIRNSQLISSVQIERKRWLQAEQQQIFEVLGEQKQLQAKFSQLILEQKPLEKAKLLKLMKRKLDLLQGLCKIKADSGLYLSHQRVLLKQCLEDVREMNTELQISNKQYDSVESQFARAESKLKNTVNDLKVVVGTSQ